MKHTAGPWIIVKEDPLFIKNERGLQICNLECPSTNESALADARLIAAAPDLLEVAKKLASLKDKWGGRSFPSTADCEFARNAIAKVEGKD